MKGNFYIYTLGCKVNSYESEAIREMMINDGYVYSEENVDVMFINTCSVTSVSDQKSRQRIRSFVKKYPSAIIVVLGCYSQMAYNFISTIEGVDIVIGTKKRVDIISLINQYKETKKQIVLVDKTTRNEEYEPISISSYSDNTRAFLKIQDGCNNFCSYCIIPYTRGGVRSRPKEEVLNEVERLVNNGYQEIVLTGIHTGGYGKDFDNYCFSDLLKDILKNPKLKRLRISSIEESEIDDAMIDLLVTESRIASHLHIPLQSGSSSVLKRMNRKYDTEQFYQKLVKIREKRPDIAITTDIIVGFPGETEEEFNETYEFSKKCEFSQIHVFPFSPRSGTPAYNMKDQIDPRIKKERVNRLLLLSNELQEQYESQFLGLELEVLFEEYDEENKIAKGHTSNYILVKIPSDVSLHNKIIKTKYLN